MKADKLDFLANKSLSELKGLAAELKLEPKGDRRLKSTWFDLSIEYRCPGIKKRGAKLRDLARAQRLRVLLEQERQKTIAIGENSPGADLVQEPSELAETLSDCWDSCEMNLHCIGLIGGGEEPVRA